MNSQIEIEQKNIVFTHIQRTRAVENNSVIDHTWIEVYVSLYIYIFIL